MTKKNKQKTYDEVAEAIATKNEVAMAPHLAQALQTARTQLAVEKRRATRAKNERLADQKHMEFLADTRQDVCNLLGVDSMISNENLLKLLKEKLEVNVDENARTTLFVRDVYALLGIDENVAYGVALNKLRAKLAANAGIDPDNAVFVTPNELQTKILKALKLEPTATADQVATALCDLSDAALAGQNLLTRLRGALNLVTDATAEQILEAIKDVREVLKRLDDPVEAVKKTTCFVEPTVVQNMILNGLDLTPSASAEEITRAFLKLRNDYNTCTASRTLGEVAVALGLEMSAPSSEIIEKARNAHQTEVDYYSAMYFGEGIETLIDGLKSLFDLAEDAEPDLEELLGMIGDAVNERNGLNEQTKTLAQELSTARTSLKDMQAHFERLSRDEHYENKEREALRESLVRLAGVAAMLGEQANAALGKFFAK